MKAAGVVASGSRWLNRNSDRCEVSGTGIMLGAVATALLRDRLMARLAEMGDSPDYVRLAEEVLAIRNAPAPLARRLVTQALVIEDRREHWQRVGEAACASAPDAPGVYLFLDADRRVLYVGKALRIRRRLRAHFAPRRWRRLTADLARVAHVEWHPVGSELEALLVEARWIRQLSPSANVQRQLGLDRAGNHDGQAEIVVFLPAASGDEAVLIAAKHGGEVLTIETSRDARDAGDVARRLLAFYDGSSGDRDAGAGDSPGLGAIVHSWLERRGDHVTRLDPRDCASVDDWEKAVTRVLRASDLFRERLVFR